MTSDQVRALLKKRQGKMTQQQLADHIGVSTSYISDIYAGKRNPAGKVLVFLGLKRETVYA